MIARKDRYKIWNSGRAFWPCRAVCRFVSSYFFDLKVHHPEHIPETGGVLIVSNHLSFLDPPFLGSQILRPMSYMAKSTLFKPGLVDKALRSMNAFPIRQGEGDIGAVRETITRLKEGALLNIFPEGSRSEDGELQTILPGAALVIRKAEVPVVPAVIEGTFEAWGPGKKWPRPYPVDVMFGPRLPVEGLKSAAIIELIGKTFVEMQTKLREMRRKSGRGHNFIPGL